MVSIVPQERARLRMDLKLYGMDFSRPGNLRRATGVVLSEITTYLSLLSAQEAGNLHRFLTPQ